MSKTNKALCLVGIAVLYIALDTVYHVGYGKGHLYGRDKRGPELCACSISQDCYVAMHEWSHLQR